MNETEIEKDNELHMRKTNIKYMIILIIILGLAHSLDEYSSLASSQIKTFILLEFFGDATSVEGQTIL